MAGELTMEDLLAVEEHRRQHVSNSRRIRQKRVRADPPVSEGLPEPTSQTAESGFRLAEPADIPSTSYKVRANDVGVEKKKRRRPREVSSKASGQVHLSRDSHFESRVLQQERRETDDEERKEKIGLLLKKWQNQEQNEADMAKKATQVKRLRKENMERMKSGRAPVFVGRGKLREMEAQEKFEDLKKSKKLDNFLKQKRKKQLIKERKANKF